MDANTCSCASYTDITLASYINIAERRSTRYLP